MLFYSYNSRICDRYLLQGDIQQCRDKYNTSINVDNYLDIALIAMNAVFTVEMLLKIIAMGLVLHNNSYLRNGWNIIDCFVTIYSYIKLSFPDWGNWAVWRTFRLLRVLKSISVLSGIRKWTTSIIVSLPTLGNVLLFLCFVFLIFGILGLQNFSGVWYNRCRYPPVFIAGRVTKHDKPWYQSIPINDRICSPDGFPNTFKCPGSSHCVNFYNIPKYFELPGVTIDNFDILDEKWSENTWWYYGVFNFDNISNSLINAFSFMTIQNWADDLTKWLDGCSSFSTRLYFNTVVVIGGFFIIKLILAAQNEALMKVNKEEVEWRLKELNIAKQKNDIVLSKAEIRNYVDKETKDIRPILNKDTIHSTHSYKMSTNSSGKRNKHRNSREGEDNRSNKSSVWRRKNRVASWKEETNESKWNPSNPNTNSSHYNNNNHNEITSSNPLNQGKKLSNQLVKQVTDSKWVQFIKLKSIHNKNEQSSLTSSLDMNIQSNEWNNGDYTNTTNNNRVNNPKERKLPLQGLFKSSKISNVNIMNNLNINNNSSNRESLISPTPSTCGWLLNRVYDRRTTSEKVFKLQHNKITVIINMKYEHKVQQIKSFLANAWIGDRDWFWYELYNISSPPQLSDSSGSSLVNKMFRNSSMSMSMSMSIKALNLLNQVKKIAFNKIKYMVWEEYSHTNRYIIFNTWIYGITTLNILFLCLISYPMSDRLNHTIGIVNIACTSVFVIEMIFKLFVLGVKPWAKDYWNIVESVIVFIGIGEIWYVRCNDDATDDSNASLSALRAIRYIRIWRLFKERSFIQKFVEFIIISLRDLVYYCWLLWFFIFIFAIAGRELFAHSITLIHKYDEYGWKHNPFPVPRENFDGWLNSLVTVFIFFIGDNWPEIMYEYSKMYLLSSQLYFISVIIIGNIMLFNLFLSILMSNYETDDKIEWFVRTKNKKNTFKATMNKLHGTVKGFRVKEYLKRVWDCYIKVPNRASSEKRRGNIIETPINTASFAKQIEKMRNYVPIELNSLICFSSKNKFRLLCARIIQEIKVTNYILLCAIIVSLTLIALDSPNWLNVTTKKVIVYLDIFTTFIFVLEAVLKSISFGFLFNGENSYLRYEYNYIDFISCIVSIVYLFLTSGDIIIHSKINIKHTGYTNVLNIIKLLRLVRVIKLIELSKSLQAALAAFYESVKQMMKIIFIGSLFILMFTIIGVNYFRGRFSRCEFERVPEVFMGNVLTKWDCMDYGGDWVTPYPNMDNVKSGFIWFYEMMTTEQWTKYMYFALDATAINKQPILNHSYRWSWFFVWYMVFAYFFLLNLAIAILSDNFNKEKEKIENNNFQLPIQNEFLKVFKQLFKVSIPKSRVKDDKWTKILINILDSIYVDVVFTALIITNLILLMINNPGQGERTKDFVSQMLLIINYIFIIEAIVKIYVYRWDYFSSGWNVWDFIIVGYTVLTLTASRLLESWKDVFDNGVFISLRVGRILRLLKKVQSWNRVFNWFINSIPGVVNVLIWYCLLWFMYSIIGMSWFYNIKYQNIIGEHWNYHDFVSSFLMLIRVTSGEGWNTIMHESVRERDGFYFCKYESEMTTDELYYDNLGCGTIWAFPFYLSFVILSTMMFLEFFSVVIASAMNDTYVLNLEELRIGTINKFKAKWATYDKECVGFMRIEKWNKFLYNIGHPLGVNSLKISDYIRIYSLLNIYCYIANMKPGEMEKGASKWNKSKNQNQNQNQNEKWKTNTSSNATNMIDNCSASYGKSFDDNNAKLRTSAEHFVFFYDVLIELTKYYLIHKTVEEEYKTHNIIFNNPEEILNNKAEAFINYMTAISEMQGNRKFLEWNPFNNVKKFSNNFILEEGREMNKFVECKKVNIHFIWAVKKISGFIRCYRCWKDKTKSVIKMEEYSRDWTEYVDAFLGRCVDMKNPNVWKENEIKRRKMNRMNPSIIREETEKLSNGSHSFGDDDDDEKEEEEEEEGKVE